MLHRPELDACMCNSKACNCGGELFNADCTVAIIIKTILFSRQHRLCLSRCFPICIAVKKTKIKGGKICLTKEGTSLQKLALGILFVFWEPLDKPQE